MSIALRTSILACLAASVLLHQCASAEPETTAAELDWVSADQLDAAAREALPWYCSGTYVTPPVESTTNNDVVSATADSIEHAMGGMSVLRGNVIVNQDQRTLQASMVQVDPVTEVADSQGPLVIRDRGIVMTGSRARTNLFDGTGVIDSATFLLHQSQMRGRAGSINRDSPTRMRLMSARITRCEPGSNFWSLRSPEIELHESEGYGTARNVTIAIKDVPIVYVPWMRFPLNSDRQSGFLMPGIGYDSKGGTDIALPYYFNLAPTYDATYQPRSLWKRGLVHDAQVRFLAGPTSNEVNLGYIHTDDLYDPQSILDATTGGTDTSGAGITPFEAQDRWYLNLRHGGGWNSRLKTHVSYSAVSDIDYLYDIGGDLGSDALNRKVSSFEQDVTGRRSLVLDRMGEVSWRGNQWSASAMLRGFQSLEPNAREQYELLPRLSASASQPLGPLDLEADFEYTWFDKDTTGITGPLAITGTRAVVHGTISMREATSWGYIKPELGVIYRGYDLEDTPANARSEPTLTTPVASLDMGLYFDRFFEARNTAWQQTLEPRLFMLYVEEDEQDDLPRFDAGPATPSYSSMFRTNRYRGEDRLGDAEQVSLGLTTRFLNRETGSRLLEASIGQVYYLADREVNFALAPNEDPKAPRSPLFMQARMSLPSGLNVAGTFEWEPDVGRSNRGTLALKYQREDRKILNFNYTYTSPEVRRTTIVRGAEETDLNFIWPIGGNWSTIGRWNFSWDRHQTVESFYGFEYNDCCWKARVVIRRFLQAPRDVTVLVDDPNTPGGFLSETIIATPEDKGIFVEFQLKGLATLGRRLDLLLEESIPGYRSRERQIGN